MDSLLKILEFEPSEAERKKKRADGDAAGADGPTRRLARPIIAVCNDLYAPALRRLREHALVFRVDKPDASRLLARLRELCRREQLAADTKSLLALVDLTDGDIRSCLNTLQFIRKSSAVLRPDHLISSQFGQKDIQQSIFKVWNSVFRKQKHNTALQDLLNEKLRQRHALGTGSLSLAARAAATATLTAIYARTTHTDSKNRSLLKVTVEYMCVSKCKTRPHTQYCWLSSSPF